MADMEKKSKKRIWLIIAAALIGILLISVIVEVASGLRAPVPVTTQLTLLGDQKITLEYGEPYQEPGYRASAMVADQTIKELNVTVQGVVDPETLGTYELIYTAKFATSVREVRRVVEVVDTCPPVISLTVDPDSYVLPGQTYVEEGFSATDNYDGDISDRVVAEYTQDAVIYTVQDSAGNQTTVTRPIVYNDPIPPELTLEGSSEITITQGTAYQEPGYHAQDNCDGDLTEQVEINGSVNVFIPGTYTLTYRVTDQYGNTATAERTVQVQGILGHGGTIYLTFDDGPSQYTPRLLDVLDKYNVKATFFVVNTSCISTITRAAAAGHTIAIHTATHNFGKIYASEDAFFEDLYKMQSVIKDLTGQTATLMRFAGGSSNTISRFNPGIMTRLTKAVTEQGFSYFDWNVSAEDAGGVNTSDEVFTNVISGISRHSVSVVLQHDSQGFSVAAVERIIQWGLANGYTFLPLTSDSPGAHHSVSN